MAFITADSVIDTSTTTGTGALTLSGTAPTGYRSFGAVMSVGDTCLYFIEQVDGSGVRTGNFETGLGTYSATNTLTRTTVSQSSNSDAAVSFSGTLRVGIGPIARTVRAPLITDFTSSGTITIDPQCKAVQYIAIGAGAGGGSGRRNAATASRIGGSGGGSGGLTNAYIPLASITGQLTVSVGVGGAGGPGPASDGATAQNGASGGDTTISLTSGGTILGGAGGGVGGNAGGSTVQPANFYAGIGGRGNVVGGNGARAALTTATCVVPSYNAGGAGGGLTTSNASIGDIPGGDSLTASGGASGGAGTASTVWGTLGSGGGGAVTNLGATATNGGAGGYPGGGGGGSAASTNAVGSVGTTFNVGGAGADGWCSIIQYF